MIQLHAFISRRHGLKWAAHFRSTLAYRVRLGRQKILRLELVQQTRCPAKTSWSYSRMLWTTKSAATITWTILCYCCDMEIHKKLPIKSQTKDRSWENNEGDRKHSMSWVEYSATQLACALKEFDLLAERTWSTSQAADHGVHNLLAYGTACVLDVISNTVITNKI